MNALHFWASRRSAPPIWDPYFSEICKLAVICLLWACCFCKAVAGPIRPLAQDHIEIARSPDAREMVLYSPSIIRLNSGRLLITYTESYKKGGGRSRQVVMTSDDGGKTWTERARLPGLQGRVFEAGGVLYYLATGAGMPVNRSDDNGETWSETRYLTSRDQKWQQTAANVWKANGCVYLVMETPAHDIDAWGAAVKIPVLMRGKLTDDLTRAENWTFARDAKPFEDLIPGIRENDPDMDFFGIPFYPQKYPKRSVMSPGRSFSPMGWAEANVVQILDPGHYWYDPSGKTFHIFMRALTGMTNYAALCKVVENEDGSMTTSLVTAPSGKKMLLMPFPGGQMRFHVLYDDRTKLYWLLSSQTTDSMTQPEALPEDRHGLASEERHRLVLHFSKNMVDWCFAGVVAVGETPKHSRHYAAMDFDGEDLVILSRSGDDGAKNAHETNLITFHRVKNFRDLVY